MNIDQIYSDIISKLGNLKSTPKGWMMKDCMVCHRYGESQDKRKRFGIKYDDGAIQTHCFNCGHKARFDGASYTSKNFKILLTELGFDEKYIKTINFNIFRDTESQQPLVNKEKPSPTKKWIPYALNDTIKPITYWLENGVDSEELIKVCEYLIERNLDVSKFFWDNSRDWKFKNRAILPLYYADEIVGFTARYAGKPKNKSTPRYYSHVPEDFIYNYSDYVNAKYIIVTEGVLDAQHVNGMAIFGNTVTPIQKELLDRHKDKVVALPDFTSDGYSFVDSAIKSGYKVSFPFWYKSYKDAAESAKNIGKIATVKSIIDGITDDKLKINVKWGLLNK